MQEWEGLPNAGVDGQVAAQRLKYGPNTWLGTGRQGLAECPLRPSLSCGSGCRCVLSPCCELASCWELA